MTARFATITCLAVALAAAACNATGAPPLPTATPVPIPSKATPATPAPVVVTPDDLRGSWTANVQGTTASSGLWTLEISSADLMLQNPVGGDLFSLGPTLVSETSLVLAADAECPDQATVTPGTYTLALTGDSLRITLVSDSCGDRSGVLVAGPWTRKP